MDHYGRPQQRDGGSSSMRCWMCVSNQTASYIIAGITLVLIIVGIGFGAHWLNLTLTLYKNVGISAPGDVIAPYAIMLVKNILMVVPTLVLFAAIFKGVSNWFYPALLGYIFYVILTIADVVVRFTSSVGNTGGDVVYTVLSILVPIYFFIVVNYYKNEVVKSESRVGVQQFNPRVRY